MIFKAAMLEQLEENFLAMLQSRIAMKIIVVNRPL